MTRPGPWRENSVSGVANSKLVNESHPNMLKASQDNCPDVFCTFIIILLRFVRIILYKA